MGLSSNQARFLSLTSRQVDLEHRIQQICQRRLRLASELENVSTKYNNSISNRKMFTQSTAGIQALSIDNLEKIGFKVINSDSKRLVGTKPPSAPIPGQISIDSKEQFLEIVNDMNSGIGLDRDYILNCDIDLSGYNTGGQSLINGNFTGTFDGNCYEISNLTINNTDPSVNPTSTYFTYNTPDDRNGLGMFSIVSGSVSNLSLDNVNISVAGNVYRTGALAGIAESGAFINNVNVENTTISGGTDSKCLGGLVGVLDSAVVNGCSADADITGAWTIGGLVGEVATGNLLNSTATGTVNCNQATMQTPSLLYTLSHVDRMAGGLVGFSAGSQIDGCSADTSVTSIYGYTGGIAGMIGGGIVSNTYSTGSVSGNYTTGGFAGDIRSATATNCYSQATVTATAWNLGGFYGSDCDVNCSINNCFYDSTLYTVGNFGPAADTGFWTNVGGLSSSDIAGHTGSFNAVTSSWDTLNAWDMSDGAPTLMYSGYSEFGNNLEENLRSGKYSLVREADEYTQDPIELKGDDYEIIDWRSVPEINDELYKGDDVDAENKYDKAIEEINAQDKRLQLEQTSVEVEYKAISSERESVKKILDQNAQNSFKYFS